MEVLNLSSNSEESLNASVDYSNYSFYLPIQIQIISIFMCIVIILIGVLGNAMVLTILLLDKDIWHSSTNIYLMNLSIADLGILLVCTPATLIESITGPHIWILGEKICIAIPFIESTIVHTSVLTILAISLERFYAICKPFQANIICTKYRAVITCLLIWLFAASFASPFLFMVSYEIDISDYGKIPMCKTETRTDWSVTYILILIITFFMFPVMILLVIYSVIVYKLHQTSYIRNESMKIVLRNRNQVIRMLCVVTLIFFICLLPLRAMMVWIIFSQLEAIIKFGIEEYFCLLYFSRIMFYLNSALNPIIYTIMSLKFKRGFYQLLKK